MGHGCSGGRGCVALDSVCLAAPDLDLGFISLEQLLFNPWLHNLPHGNTEGTGWTGKGWSMQGGWPRGYLDRLKIPLRLAKCRACASCLGFPCVLQQCPPPGGDPEGRGMGVGRSPGLQPLGLCWCISLLNRPESKQPCAAAVLFNPFVIKND